MQQQLSALFHRIVSSPLVSGETSSAGPAGGSEAKTSRFHVDRGARADNPLNFERELEVRRGVISITREIWCCLRRRPPTSQLSHSAYRDSASLPPGHAHTTPSRSLTPPHLFSKAPPSSSSPASLERVYMVQGLEAYPGASSTSLVQPGAHEANTRLVGSASLGGISGLSSFDDRSINQRIDNRSINQRTDADDRSSNQRTDSDDRSINQKTDSDDRSINQFMDFDNRSINQRTCSNSISNTNASNITIGISSGSPDYHTMCISTGNMTEKSNGSGIVVKSLQEISTDNGSDHTNGYGMVVTGTERLAGAGQVQSSGGAFVPTGRLISPHRSPAHCVSRPTLTPILTPPLKLRAKGLLERRGSNASLTIDLCSSSASESPIVGSPPRESCTGEFLTTSSNRLMGSQLDQCVRNPSTIYEQFWEIPMNHQDKLEVPGSAVKNRYRTILPNAGSRVRLKSRESSPGAQFPLLPSYINANYIRGYKGEEKAYIATQGPMSNTVSDFWYMIWQEQTPVIVMITKLREQNRTKCECYLPVVGESCVYDDIEVRVDSEIVCESYVKRYITLARSRNPTYTASTQANQEASDTSDTASDANSTAVAGDTACSVASVQPGNANNFNEYPVATGATGFATSTASAFTYANSSTTISSLAKIPVPLAADTMSSSLATAADVDKSTSANANYLRSLAAATLSTTAVCTVASTTKSTAVTAKNCASATSEIDYINTLVPSQDNSPKRFFIGDISPSICSSHFKTSTTENVATVHTSAVKSETTALRSPVSDYEGFTDALRTSLAVISCDTNDKDINSIMHSSTGSVTNVAESYFTVSNDDSSNVEPISRFNFPSEATRLDADTSVTHSSNTAELRSTVITENPTNTLHNSVPNATLIPGEATRSAEAAFGWGGVSDREEVLRDTGTSGKLFEAGQGMETRQVIHYWFTAWPDHKTSDSSLQLLDMINDVERSRRDGLSGGVLGPVAVHCSAGIGRTGCFIATSIGVQQLREENSVDVLSIVCNLRLDRGGMVQTDEQYEYIHQLLNLYNREFLSAGKSLESSKSKSSQDFPTNDIAKTS